MGDVIVTLKLHVICKKKQRKILPLLCNSAYCKHDKAKSKAKDLLLNSGFSAQSHCYPGLLRWLSASLLTCSTQESGDKVQKTSCSAHVRLPTFRLAFLLPKWYQSSEKQQLKVWSADSASLKILWQDNKTASRCWRHLSFYATPSHVAYPGVLILLCTQMTSNVTLQHHPPPSVLDMCVQPPDDTDGMSNKNLKHKS